MNLGVWEMLWNYLGLRIVKYLLYNHAGCNLDTLSQATGIPIEELKIL